MFFSAIHPGATNASLRDITSLNAATGLIQNMLKEGELTKLSEEEQCRICSILCTAEYCMETTQQLEVGISSKGSCSGQIRVNFGRKS